MEPVAVLIYSHKSKYQEILERQLSKAQIGVLHHELTPFTWDGLIRAQYDIAKSNPDQLLVFVDAWDVVLIGNVNNLRGKKYETGVVISGERNCWPDPSLAPEYEAKQGHEMAPWRYINTGVIVGVGREIASVVGWGLANCPLPPSTDNILDEHGTDMKFWTELYLRGPYDIRVDDKGELTYTMIGANKGELATLQGKWMNTLTWKMPVFVHANGGGTIPAVMLK